MKNDIIRKLTSLTLMSIMVAGGLTFAIPGALPHAVAESATSGPLTVSTTEFGGPQILEIIVDDPKIAEVGVTHASLFISVGDEDVQMAQASTGDWYVYVGHSTAADPTTPPTFPEAPQNNDSIEGTTQNLDIEDGDELDVTYGDNTITVTYADDLSGSASVAFDRADAPAGAVVHLTIADTRLNLDPTADDIWTLTLNSTNNDPRDGVVTDAQAAIGYNHGILELNLADFDIRSAGDTGLVYEIIFDETGDNTGEFTARDVTVGTGDDAEDLPPLTLKESVQENAPVDISYADNDARLTVRVTDSSITIAAADVWSSGEEATVTLTYPDLNLNTDVAEDIKIEHEFVPTIIIGNPTTIADFSHNNTIAPGSTNPESKIFTFSNYTTSDDDRDIRTDAATFDISDFSSDAPFHFVKFASNVEAATFVLSNATEGAADGNIIVDNNNATAMIAELPSEMTLVVTGVTTTGFVADDVIAFDILSFGDTGDGVANNAIYRQLLEETEDGGVFTGTLKYTMLNQANVAEVGTYEDVETLGADLAMVIDDEYTGNEFHISYNEKSHPADILTNTGTVSLDSDRYSTNGEVTVTLEDLDLNADSTSIDSYVLNQNGKVRGGADGGGPILQVFIEDVLWDDRCNKGFGLPPAFELAETAAGSGTFTATFAVPTQYCTDKTDIDGNNLSADATGKSIKVVYYDFRDDGGNDADASDSATIQAVTGTVSLDRNVYPVPADGKEGNVIVHIEINDPDLNIESDIRNTIELAGSVELRLRAINTGDSDPINTALNDKSIDLRYSLVNEDNLGSFMETTVDSGIFAETVEIPANLQDDEIGLDERIERSYVLTVEYTDTSDATGEESKVTDSAIFNVGSATLSADDDEYTINQNAFITLTDHDRNYDSAERDTIPLTDIAWEGSTDTDLAGGFDPTPSSVLRETEINSGIFLVEITIPKKIGTDDVERGERVTLTYDDISPAGSNYPNEGSSTDVQTSFAISRTGASMTLDKDVYSWREHVTVTVIAPDANIDDLVVESIDINAHSQGGDLTAVPLSESGSNTGIFQGTLELGGPEGSNIYLGISCSEGQLCVENEDGFSVTYRYDEDERDIIQSALIRWNVAEVTWLADSYREGSVGTLRVIDPDMNFHPDAPDSISTVVFSDTFRGGTNVALTETEPASGVFEGEILFDVLHTEGNRLQVSEGDIVTATYKDQTLPPPDDRGDTIRITGTATIGSIVPPLERVEVSNLGVVDALNNAVDSVSVGQQVNIAADLTSAQSRSQDYAYLLQIQNMDGVTVHLSWAASSLAGFGGANVSQSWTPDETGSYTATVFVWESLTNPTALSPQNSIDITVV